MKKLIIGTTNPAKVEKIRHILSELDIEVLGVNDLGLDFPSVKETGKSAQENARIKATAYAKASGKPVLSSDSAVFIEELKEEEQPGVRIRRIKEKGQEASDNEMRKYYSDKIRRLGGRATIKVIDGVCLATPQGKTFETTIISTRILATPPCQTKIKGHPLDSFQIDPVSGKFFAEMNDQKENALWKNLIGTKLLKFIRETLKKL